MRDTIFGYTREELVDMFEPIAEIQEKASDMVMDMQKDSKTKRIMIVSTADFKKNTLLWLQQKIENSKMSKADKEQVISWIGSTIDMVFKSGYAYHIKESGSADEYVKAMAESFIGKEE